MLKGAPDIVLPRCSDIGMTNGVRPMTAADRGRVTAEVDRLTGDAQRVIAVAVKNGEFSENKLTFLALFGMKDPPRREVRPAVKICREAGIKPVMITGDHAATARAIAREVGILMPGDRVIEGHEIERMSDAELRAAAAEAAVFARVSPRHKLRIVRAFKQSGHVAAMTGDGVNDAPAVKEADIGVAMGVAGSDVTKEASSVVVLDDNFATIVAAIEEGRIIYQNIRRFIQFLLASNFGEVLTVVLAMALGMPAIFLPIQILLINLVTDGLPAIALGMDPAGDGIMKRPPRPVGEGLFSGGLVSSILFRGAVLGLCNVLCFAMVLRRSGDLVMARSAAYMTLVIAQMLYVLECKLESGVRRMLNNKTLIIAVALSVGMTLAVVYLPVLQKVFATTAVAPEMLGPVALSVAINPIMGLLSAVGQKKKK
jgi:Ca2+-transporting ATPase